LIRADDDALSQAEQSRRRNREEKLSAIIRWVREVLPPLAPGSEVDIDVDGFRLTAARLPSGTAFAVFKSGTKLLVGVLDPDPPGIYLNGSVHIAWWKKGDWNIR
jgi:hypothetical protein